MNFKEIKMIYDDNLVAGKAVKIELEEGEIGVPSDKFDIEDSGVELEIKWIDSIKF